MTHLNGDVVDIGSDSFFISFIYLAIIFDLIFNLLDKTKGVTFNVIEVHFQCKTECCSFFMDIHGAVTRSSLCLVMSENL